jgi:hypothetical protein
MSTTNPFAVHDHKEAERCLRMYRTHFHYDHFARKSMYHGSGFMECYDGTVVPVLGHTEADRSFMSSNELLESAAWIEDYGYYIVIINANTAAPKVRMRRMQ